MSSGTQPRKRSKATKATKATKVTSPAVGPVEVGVHTDAKGRSASLPDPGHGKVRVKPGGSITWHFNNTSGKDMALGVANFHPSKRYAGNPNRWPHPLEGGDPVVKMVKKGGKESVECRLVPRNRLQFDNNPFITYKYDIVDGQGNVLLDPEIEIPDQAI